MKKARREKLKRCILDESVYNLLSLHGDCNAKAVYEILLNNWTPAWAPVEEVVTIRSVRRAMRRLAALGLIALEGDHARVAIRNRRTGRGHRVRTDYGTGALTMKRRHSD